MLANRASMLREPSGIRSLSPTRSPCRVTLRRYGASFARKPCFSQVNDQSRRFGRLVEFASSGRKSQLCRSTPSLLLRKFCAVVCACERSTDGARARLRNFMVVADDVSRRADAHVKFFFLLWPEKTHVPIPDVQLRRHQLVGLLHSRVSPFEIGLRVRRLDRRRSRSDSC